VVTLKPHPHQLQQYVNSFRKDQKATPNISQQHTWSPTSLSRHTTQEQGSFANY
jgi:hypothetical protein